MPACDNFPMVQKFFTFCIAHNTYMVLYRQLSPTWCYTCDDFPMVQNLCIALLSVLLTIPARCYTVNYLFILKDVNTLAWYSNCIAVTIPHFLCPVDYHQKNELYQLEISLRSVLLTIPARCYAANYLIILENIETLTRYSNCIAVTIPDFP